MTTYDVAIVGGGIAGSACAVSLGKLGISTVLIERNLAQKHKLCGEFISGEVADYFESLGVLTAVKNAGAVRLRESRVTSRSGRQVSMTLPGKPFGLSRFSLDSVLRKEAQNAGAVLLEGDISTVHKLEPGYQLTTGSEQINSKLVVGAYGRRSKLDRVFNRPFIHAIHSAVAFKTHVENVDTADRVELFAFDGGYCGTSRVEDGLTNVCWISSQERLKSVGGNPRRFWNEVLPENRVLQEVLDGVEPAHEFSSSSQLFFTAKEPVVNGMLMIGDAAGMIAPLAGDGMAMAIDSAVVASKLVEKHLDGRIDVEEMEASYTTARSQRYRTRMITSRLLHSALSSPVGSGIGIAALSAAPPLARLLVRLTRGSG